MKLSIVTSMYQSAPYIEEFYRRICATTDKFTSDYEIILINDGSPDNSLDIALSMHKKDRRVKVINLSRNFGQHKALMVGLEYARGELVFQIDCDLEEEPELLEKFYLEIKNSSAAVVFGVRNTRKGRFFDRFTGRLFYKLFNLFSFYPVPSEPKRKIAMFVNAITSFSNKPLVYIFYLGCTISFLSGIAALYLIIRRLFFDVLLSGWPSLIVSVWLMGGLTLFCLGLIGIYLSKIFIETKQRPYAIIEDIYDTSRTSK
ncbi:MAG: glycosyltransferase [Sedimentisphaerales bacterium]